MVYKSKAALAHVVCKSDKRIKICHLRDESQPERQ